MEKQGGDHSHYLEHGPFLDGSALTGTEDVESRIFQKNGSIKGHNSENRSWQSDRARKGLNEI